MNKSLFMGIVHRLSTEIPYFRLTEDATGRTSLSPLQKCTAAIRQLAYGGAADQQDKYIRLAETTARKCLHNFTAGIITLFDDEYLRHPTPEDLERLLHTGDDRGFPGMIGSIDFRKDVERAFGVLQARFAVVKNPSKLWDKEKIGNIMKACIILHNMIVEDERDSDTIEEFQDEEFTFTVKRPTKAGNAIGRRKEVRDSHIHQQLKRI
uniref:DDE Tnp4 domain-containing protein n=1 Tax=Brassica oleracea var. oleracea TaxID=109376 RepID=A0A0D3BSP0_BRAOL